MKLGSKSNTGAAEMTRRAFLSSKSNTGAAEIQIKHASQKIQELAQQNEDISKKSSNLELVKYYSEKLKSMRAFVDQDPIIN